MANLLLIDAPHLDPNTVQAEFACILWQKRNRIELLKALVPAVAGINPDKAREFAEMLMDEVMPQLKKERVDKNKRDIDLLNEETKFEYQVTSQLKTKQTKRTPEQMKDRKEKMEQRRSRRK